MYKILSSISLFFALGIFTTSCVSNRKFTEEVKARETAQNAVSEESKKRQAAQDAQAQAETQIVSLKKELSELQVKYDKLNATYESQMIAYERLQKTNDDLRKTYESVLAMNDRLVKESEGRKRELSEDNANKAEELRKKGIELADKEADLRRQKENLDRLRQEMQGKDSSLASMEAMKKELEKGLADREKQVKELEKGMADREKRVKELEQSILDRDAKAKALKDKLNDALKGFQASDLTVEERNGRVYVSLSQNLLFASGSSKLDSKGAGAIVKLSEVLNKNADIAVLVEGHTDSDGDEKTNWRLSSERSLSITDELIKNNLNPERITAAGRGEHSPIAANTTPEGKAKNRRTDIILSPKLDVIYDMLKK